MLRILIPALQVGPGQTGVGVYTRELIRGMCRQPRREEIVVLAPHPDAFVFLEGVEGFRVVPIRLLRENSWGRMLALHTEVPRLADRLGVDVVMAPNFVAPAWGNFRSAVLVHDLTHVHFPETMPQLKRLYYSLVVRRSIRRSNCVFVTTEAMAREVLSFVPEARGKLRIAPGGVAPEYLANGDGEAENGLLQARRDSLLFVGTLEPRKNLERLLAAHGNLCRSDPDFPVLRIVGGKGWRDKGIVRALRGHPAPSRVEVLGYSSAADLRGEYRSALALLFPSLYEGFGLPAVEAMASGCPVMTSRNIATAEVAGDAALLVDPTEIGDLERGMRLLADDEDLRRRLSKAGRVRAREFSWDRCARLTLDALHELGSSSTIRGLS